MEKEKTSIVRYVAADGQEIELTFENVRKYLVSGRPEFVKLEELIFFMGVCKSKGLNPFKRDAYLIKYTEKDPAAIVTSIDFYRSRARAQKDCQGWKAGIIVRDRKGNIIERQGHFILEDEELLGGWFEAKPVGWAEARKHTVPLKPYIKKTAMGEPTRFWSVENQPLMIMKVAEAQGLRMVWPDLFEKIYTEEEILESQPKPSPIITNGEATTKTTTEVTTNLDSKVTAQDIINNFKKEFVNMENYDENIMSEFIKKIASLNRKPEEEIMLEAIKRKDAFVTSYRKYFDKKRKEEVQNGG